MIQLYQPSIFRVTVPKVTAFRVTATVLLSLATYTATCMAGCAATKAAMSVDALAMSVDPLKGEAIALSARSAANPLIAATVTTVVIAQKAGNLLSPQQMAQLTRLPIPIVVPTDLPVGFRLVRAEGESGSYANGDDDSGYAIDYQGKKNTCLSIRSTKDGPRGLERVGQVQTRFGLVAVYMEKLDGNKSLVSFLGIKGNPVLISGGVLPDSTASNGWQRCRAVSLETYTQVLRSLTVLK